MPAHNSIANHEKAAASAYDTAEALTGQTITCTGLVATTVTASGAVSTGALTPTTVTPSTSVILADSLPVILGTGSDRQIKYDGTNDVLVVEPVTTGLWSGCPSPADPDPYKYVEVFDDFVTGVATGTHWITLDDGATGTNAYRTADPGGVINIVTAAADNDYHAMRTTSTPFDLVNAKALWFEARFRLAEATTNDSAWWFGLTSEITTGGFQADALGPLGTYDGVMVWKDEDSMSVLSETSNAGTQATNTTMGTFVTNTWTRVGFFVSGAATTGVATFYVELTGSGPLVAFGTTQNITRAGLVPMYVVFGVKAGPGAAAETLQVDYVKCVQLR